MNSPLNCFTKPALITIATVLIWALMILWNAPQAQTVSLFNGQSLDGWYMDVPAMDSLPDGKKPFLVRESQAGPVLVSLGTPGGHLLTEREFSDYRLEVDYRFSGEPGNCGVLVHASTPRALYDMFPQSLEVQMQHQQAGDFWCIVEDITVPDMIKRRGPEDNWGIIEGKARRIENLTNDSEKAPGEWNNLVIECRKDTVEVWLNGDLVNFGYHCTATKGKIALQAEGSAVEFRKIELTYLFPRPLLTEDYLLQISSGTIYGTILRPDVPEPVPVALLIAGSGNTDRNGNNPMMQNNSLKYLANDLASHGIASLRYDKRGIAASQAAMKNESDLVFDDYVSDAKAWIKQLSADPRFEQIFVIGHSEGSLVGMLASELPEVDKYISLAGAGQPIDRVLRKQLSLQPENIYQESCEIMDVLLTGKTVDSIPPYLNSLFRPSVQPYLINWFQHDPAEILSKLNKPILIVQGNTDIQVSTEEAQLLQTANPEAQMAIIDSMNHVFKIAPEQRLFNLSTYNNPKLPNHPQLIEYIVAFAEGKTINAGGHILWAITDSQETHDGYPYWSPDGKSVIYSSGSRTTCQTRQINLASGQNTLLINEFAQHARWSPDETSLIYAGDLGSSIKVWSNTNTPPVEVNTGNISFVQSALPCWSPNGDQIAFTANGKIYIMDYPEGTPKIIFEKPGQTAISFDWPLPHLILADVRENDQPEEADIWIISLTGEENKPLITLPGKQVKPALSPDGETVLFTSNHQGNADLWLTDLNGKEPQRLTFFEGDLLNPGYDLEASWSPDGQKIAFSSTRSGYWAIWIMKLCW